MEAVLYIFAKVISLLLSAISLAMFARVIMEIASRITSYDVGGNKLYVFCYAVTEIFVTPFRFMCAKLNWFQGTPIDVPFFIAYITISLLQSFLPII
jgi:hypothetical protein